MTFQKSCAICGHRMPALDMLVVHRRWWVCGLGCAMSFEKRWQAENGPPQHLHEEVEEFSL